MRSEPEWRGEALSAAVAGRCWNRIGVHGDGSCDLLDRHVHCRNCTVFSAAAANLLDRDVPSDHMVEWTRIISGAKPSAMHDTDSVVIFRVGLEWLALPTAIFEEIAGPRPLHSLPHRGGTVAGIVNVRGELLVCLSLGHVLGIDKATPGGRCQSEARLLVLGSGRNRVVCPVDEVLGVHRFEQRLLQDPPAASSRSGLAYIRAILRLPQHVVGVLDDQQLFQTFNRSLASATVT
jgi:chemotaxis-related protein WspD